MARTSAAGGEHAQSHGVGPRRQAVFLPLEVEVSSLPFLVADADAVGDGQGGGLWFVSELQQLELVEQRGPGRNIWLPEREQRHVRQQGTVAAARRVSWNASLRTFRSRARVTCTQRTVFFFFFFQGAGTQSYRSGKDVSQVWTEAASFLVMGKAHAPLYWKVWKSAGR